MTTALILFESSGVMREAFRSLGVDAYSCDLQPADDGSPYHFQKDAYDLISPKAGSDFNFDVIVAHPMCTKMCVSGNHVYAAGKPRHQERIDAVRDTERVWNYACKRAKIVIFENPVGVLTTMSILPKPQYVQPYEFGDDASKKTALFIHGAGKVPIDPSKRVAGRLVNWKGKTVERWSNQCDSGQNKLGPSDDRWKVRSKTYSGLADAVAKHVVNELTNRKAA